jgi:type I restriction-modification system DNA methylase subunit
MSDSISLSQLESHLWEAANILRGPVDAADFKTYVFPLLFFKRISDVYDEEYAAALAESGGDEEYAQFPQNYRFQIPKECHWNDVRVVATNDDEKIQRHEDCPGVGRVRWYVRHVLPAADSSARALKPILDAAMVRWQQRYDLGVTYETAA